MHCHIRKWHVKQAGRQILLFIPYGGHGLTKLCPNYHNCYIREYWIFTLWQLWKTQKEMPFALRYVNRSNNLRQHTYLKISYVWDNQQRLRLAKWGWALCGSQTVAIGGCSKIACELWYWWNITQIRRSRINWSKPSHCSCS